MEKELTNIIAPEIYPVLPLRDLVMFPHMIVPLFVGREKSIQALHYNPEEYGNKMLLVAQKDVSIEEPELSDLYKVGVVVRVLQILKLQDGTVKILVDGNKRVKVQKYFTEEEVDKAQVIPLEDETYDPESDELVVLRRSVMQHFENYIKLHRKVSPEVLGNLSRLKDIAKLCDAVSAHLAVKLSKKQEILETTQLNKKLERILILLDAEIELLNTETRIRSRVRTQIEKNQKDYYLNEQLKAIHKELGEEDFKEEIAYLTKKIKKLKLTAEAKKKVESEMKKLKTTNPMSAESSVIRNYIEWVVDLPWKIYSAIRKDIDFAAEVLNRDHYGLEKIKERILEYLAVGVRTEDLKSPIICLVGPPGVGKTSLAKSIAEATGRKFVKISLGGLRDEAEIKGHRRTYIGSMPGKILQAMKKAGTSNPVILLDEIDKMGYDHRGDPSSALLEVLDPEQNYMFNDHYLEVDYDLSKVLFIATANTTNIPRPLMDRMEVVRISGYTEEEKMNIAIDHLIPKELKAHGLALNELTLTKEAIIDIIHYYTREAGVRNLNRELAKICRKVVKKIVANQVKEMIINRDQLQELLGAHKFLSNEIENENMVGISTGLAYTEVGGDILSIEVLLMHGKGEVKITGKLGDVMKESAQAAVSYVRSRAVELGINPHLFRKRDIHIHVPEGATPKDGPSAGIALLTSIVSAFTGIPVHKTIAMTGELTLRGRVLAIGGLKEKLLAAMRAGIEAVIIPKANMKDLEEVPQQVKDRLSIFPTENAYDVLVMALTQLPQPLQWQDDWDEIDHKNASTSGIMAN